MGRLRHVRPHRRRPAPPGHQRHRLPLPQHQRRRIRRHGRLPEPARRGRAEVVHRHSHQHLLHHRMRRRGPRPRLYHTTGDERPRPLLHTHLLHLLPDDIQRRQGARRAALPADQCRNGRTQHRPEHREPPQADERLRILLRRQPLAESPGSDRRPHRLGLRLRLQRPPGRPHPQARRARRPAARVRRERHGHQLPHHQYLLRRHVLQHRLLRQPRHRGHRRQTRLHHARLRRHLLHTVLRRQPQRLLGQQRQDEHHRTFRGPLRKLQRHHGAVPPRGPANLRRRLCHRRREVCRDTGRRLPTGERRTQTLQRQQGQPHVYEPREQLRRLHQHARRHLPLAAALLDLRWQKP